MRHNPSFLTVLTGAVNSMVIFAEPDGVLLLTARFQSSLIFANKDKDLYKHLWGALARFLGIATATRRENC
jgi:hypothetical protein